MTDHEIQIEVELRADNRQALGRLTDRIVGHVERLIEDDPDLHFSLSIRSTCTATIWDR